MFVFFIPIEQIAGLRDRHCGWRQLHHDLHLHQNLLQSRIVAVDAWRDVALRIHWRSWVG